MHNRWLVGLVSLLAVFTMGCPAVQARNTHGTPDPGQEAGAWWADQYAGSVLDLGCLHGTSGTTSVSMAPCRGYAMITSPAPVQLRYFEETVARTIIYSGGNTTHWVIGRAQLNVTPGGWTCPTGTHYCWFAAATRPALPDGGTWLLQVTVAGGAVAAVADISQRVLTWPQTLTTSRAIGQGGHWRMTTGALLTLDPGVTLTVKGCIEAGTYQIFTGTGLVRYAAGSPCTTIRPEWWGATGDGRVVDQKPYFQAASEALEFSGGTILGAGPNAIYVFTTGQWDILHSNITFDGQGALFLGEGSSSIRIRAWDGGDQSASGETDQFLHNVHLKNYRVGNDAVFPANQMQGGALFGCVDCSMTNITIALTRGTAFTTHRCYNCLLDRLSIRHGAINGVNFCTLLLYSFNSRINNWYCSGAADESGPTVEGAMQIKGGEGNTISNATLENITNPTLKYAFFTRGDAPYGTSNTDPNLVPYPYPLGGSGEDCKTNNCYLTADPRRATANTQWLNLHVRNVPHAVCFHVQEGFGDTVANLQCDTVERGIQIAQSLLTGALERNISITGFRIELVGTQTTNPNGDGLYGIYLNGAGSASADGEAVAVKRFRDFRFANGLVTSVLGAGIEVKSASRAFFNNISVFNTSLEGDSEKFAVRIGGASTQVSITNSQVSDDTTVPVITSGIFVHASASKVTLTGNRVLCDNCGFGVFRPYAIDALGSYSNNIPALCEMETVDTTVSGSRCRIPFKDAERASVVVRCQAWTGSLNTAYYERRAAVRYEAPTLTITETPTPGNVDIETDTDWNVTLVASTNGINVSAVGDVGQTVRWSCNADTILGR